MKASLPQWITAIANFITSCFLLAIAVMLLRSEMRNKK